VRASFGKLTSFYSEAVVIDDPLMKAGVGDPELGWFQETVWRSSKCCVSRVNWLMGVM
jgi:hypothetical protein